MATISVWITTYNHEKFIAQAIESVLAQILTHKLEIIIGEDCSTDQTRKIVSDYHEKFPNVIKLYLPDKNIGCNNMFHTTYPLCTGDYIAWLDGDDFWTSPYKLQMQIDILEQNPDLLFCFHQVCIEDEITKEHRESTINSIQYDTNITFDEFISKDLSVYAPSLVHKNIFHRDLPAWFHKSPLADLAFYYHLFDLGNGYYINKKLGVYRIHNEGSWSGASFYDKNHRFGEFYHLIKPFYPKYKQYFEHKICFHFSLIFELEVLSRNFKNAFKYLSIIKDNGFKGIGMRKLWVIKLIIKLILSLFRNKKIIYT